MTIRNLEYLFKPRSVALIGASRSAGSTGAVVARNLFKSGFEGPVMPVNPKYRAVEGVLAYADVASLPVPPDLAVIATPAPSVPEIIAALAGLGTRAAVVISAGVDDELRQRMLDAARPHLLRIVGPGALGLLTPGAGLNASFSHLAPRQGHLAFVAQSGAIVTTVLDWAESHHIGFSHLISLGGMADVDFGDLLDYLANDPDTRAILLYLETVSQARKFMSAARAAARSKPVLVVKAGRHAESARATASHTGALTGSDAVYDAAFRRAGMLRVASLDELFTAVETLATMPPPRGDRLAIVTNDGGIGALATDTLIELGGRTAELSGETLERLDGALPRGWPRGNPVDILGDAADSRYAAALEILAPAPGTDAVLVLNAPTAIVDRMESARAVIAATGRLPGDSRHRRPVVLTSWVGAHTAAETRRLFARHGIPTYATPEAAVRAFMHLVSYRRSQETLLETPPSVPEAFTADVATARRVIQKALDAGRAWLTEPETQRVLAAYGVPVVPTRIAATVEEALAAARELDAPAALKILSPDVGHKSDVGGVVLGLEGDEAVREAAEAMIERVRRIRPGARIDGFSLQPTVRRPGAWELIAGVVEDVQFGPVILFGDGGTAVELIRDKALGLPPLNMRLAHDIIARTRVHRQLRGYRDRPAADLDAIALTLIRLAQLVTDLAGVVELDINPLLADADGVLALDARLRAGPDTGAGSRRLAIRPYPRELEEAVPRDGGPELLLRPILPEDEPKVREAFAQLTPEEIRLRFFAPMRSLSHVAAARFTQIDYDREMVLVLTDPGIPGRTELYGTVQINADPDNERAEFAVIVRHDMAGRGLGRMLMERIIAHCRRRGIGVIYGDVLRENRAMLRLCERLGFRRHRDPEDPEVVRVELSLA